MKQVKPNTAEVSRRLSQVEACSKNTRLALKRAVARSSSLVTPRLKLVERSGWDTYHAANELALSAGRAALAARCPGITRITFDVDWEISDGVPELSIEQVKVFRRVPGAKRAVSVFASTYEDADEPLDTVEADEVCAFLGMTGADYASAMKAGLGGEFGGDTPAKTEKAIARLHKRLLKEYHKLVDLDEVLSLVCDHVWADHYCEEVVFRSSTGK